VAGFRGTEGEFKGRVQEVLGCELPPRVGEVRGVRGTQIFLTGPAQFWIFIQDNPALIPALKVAISPEIGAITTLSHSRTCLSIEGVASREILASAIALDLHPEVFRLGHFALTGWHHTPILLFRTGEDRYELCAMRTFAQWVWEGLLDAALPLGYEVVQEAGTDPRLSVR
jgi:sarcosine oxidase subunit gamma